uniref:DUF4005 domain-containing protein n=1 Tax=Brassica oleracea TaxID=3712 RepID=A0A3P6DKS7_BRAOL|nr:unnamed protein product [Brassica oleracea]
MMGLVLSLVKLLNMSLSFALAGIKIMVKRPNSQNSDPPSPPQNPYGQQPMAPPTRNPYGQPMAPPTQNPYESLWSTYGSTNTESLWSTNGSSNSKSVRSTCCSYDSEPAWTKSESERGINDSPTSESVHDASSHSKPRSRRPVYKSTIRG